MKQKSNISSRNQIILFDDDEIIHQIIDYIVKKNFPNCELVAFKNSEAIDDLNITKTALFMLDYNIRPYEGPIIFRKIRDINLSVPIIGLSSDIQDDEIRIFKEMGFTGVVSKPINMPAFVGYVEAILAGTAKWKYISSQRWG